MICIPCREQAHDLCDNGPENPHGTWCDCHHRAPVRTTMSPEEYAQALSDLAEIRQQQKERRALVELTFMAQKGRLGDHGTDL